MSNIARDMRARESLERACMRTVCMALATLTAASLVEARPAAAGEKPWCAQLFGGSGGDPGRTCGYVSWEQCRATTGVQGGFCLPNPAYRTASVEVQARRRKQR
jgi:hypothetical protein